MFTHKVYVDEMYSLRNHIVAQARPDKLKELIPGPLARHADYQVAKGGSDAVETEILATITGLPNVDLTPYLVHMRQHLKDFVPEAPLPWSHVIGSKDPLSSPGLPLRNAFGSWAEFVSSLGEGAMARIECELQETEDRIIAGDFPLSSFHVFSKRDKYSRKKVATRNFRTIQCGDSVLLFMSQRWLSKAKEQVEALIPGFFTVTDKQSYQAKVAPLRDSFTFGVDFTAYDKHQLQTLMSETISLICDLAELHPNLKKYFITSITSCTLVLPTESDSVVEMTGGNPSGQFLTSFCNTMGHLLMNTVVYKTLFDLNPAAFWASTGPVRSVATGDDGLESFTSKASAELACAKIPQLLDDLFGIPAKIETLADGSVFPPGLLAPYLSRVEVRVPGAYVLVPARPNRSLGYLQWASPNDALDPNFASKQLERMAGIRNNLCGFEVIQQLLPGYPVPDAVLDFYDECERAALGNTPPAAFKQVVLVG